MRTMLLIIWVDIKRVTKDRPALFWMFVMPLVFAAFLGNVFSGLSSTLWIPVVDLDRSELSQLFIEQMEAQDGYYVDVKGAAEESHIKDYWHRGAVIPAGFQEQILAGEQVEVTFVKGRESMDKILDMQMCVAHAIALFTKGLARADVCSGPWDASAKSALEAALEAPDILIVEKKGHDRLKSAPMGFHLSLPGFLVMFVLLMTVSSGGETLVADRRQGSFVRLSAAPASALEIYAGKILARILLACLQSALLLAFGIVLFKLSLGRFPLYLVPVIFCLAVFAGSLSLFFGFLCRTENQVNLVAIAVGVILASLGGCWWPLEIVPPLFQQVARLTPSYWALHGLQRVMHFDRSYEVLLFECPILLACAAVVFACVWPLLRRSPSHA